MSNGGVPWWCCGLSIQCCHCSGSIYCCGAGLIPGLGTSTCHGLGQKKKNQSLKSVKSVKQELRYLQIISAWKMGCTCFYCSFLTFSVMLTSGFLALCFLCLQKIYNIEIFERILSSHLFKQLMHCFPSYSCYTALICTQILDWDV